MIVLQAGEILLPTPEDGVYFQITPSRINPWRDHRDPASVFTFRQLAEMRERGIDPARCETIDVRSPISEAERYLGVRLVPCFYLIRCPIVARSRAGTRILIIGPRGSLEWINSDGTTHDRRQPAKGGGTCRS